jgi:hypothetical protein
LLKRRSHAREQAVQFCRWRDYFTDPDERGSDDSISFRAATVTEPVKTKLDWVKQITDITSRFAFSFMPL